MTITDDQFIDQGFAPVPVIDIAPFFDGDAESRAEVVRQLNEACEGVGFITVVGHGVDPALIADVYRVGYAFFQQPLDEKRKAGSPILNRFQGYAAPGLEPGAQISERQSFNNQYYDTLDEAFAAGYPDDIGDALFPAVWPEYPADFRAVWRRYHEAMEGLARRLLAIFDVALGLPDGWFESQVELDPSSTVGNFYSFEVDSGREVSPYRFKAHVDGSIITILYQDDGPGSLQLHQRGKGWRDVQAVEGAYVVNLGEIMARWTNDRYVATPHRVLRPPETETAPRMSVPFFLKPPFDTVIAPIPELIAEGDTPHYQPTTGRAWLTRTQRDDYDSGAEFAKVAGDNPLYK